MENYTLSSKLVLSISLLCALLLTGCEPAAEVQPQIAASSAVITSPLDQTQYAMGDLVVVRSQISAPEGVTDVIMLVNGQPVRNDLLELPLKSGAMNQSWLPPSEGAYTLQVLAATGGSYIQSGEVVIQVGAADNIPQVTVATLAPTIIVPTVATIVVTPSITPTKTLTPILGPPMATTVDNANCRYGPGQVYEVISYLLNGQSSQIMGRNAETSWWVIERLDGDGTCWIWDGVVTVSGDISNVPVVEQPPTQTPSPVPLGAPSPYSPSGVQSCRSTVWLEWSTVSHPNGIAHYEWVLDQKYSPGEEYHSWDSGSTANTSVEVGVRCGIYFRWQVRAVDGMGSPGPYSIPMEFRIE